MLANQMGQLPILDTISSCESRYGGGIGGSGSLGVGGDNSPNFLAKTNRSLDGLSSQHKQMIHLPVAR